jgi:hypothetical protein
MANINDGGDSVVVLPDVTSLSGVNRRRVAKNRVSAAAF